MKIRPHTRVEAVQYLISKPLFHKYVPDGLNQKRFDRYRCCIASEAFLGTNNLSSCEIKEGVPLTLEVPLNTESESNCVSADDKVGYNSMHETNTPRNTDTESDCISESLGDI